MSDDPLLGRYLLWEDNARGYNTLSYFKTRLMMTLYLMEQLQSADGDVGMGGDYVLNLNALGLDDSDDKSYPRAQIFNTYEDYREFRDWVPEDTDRPKVAQLVPKP